MNQLVGLIVGCILFFWGMSFFLNKSLAGINNIQVAKSGSFATQSYSQCTKYLSGAESALQNISFTQMPKGDCFAVAFPSSQQHIPEWKIRLFIARESVRGFFRDITNN